MNPKLYVVTGKSIFLAICKRGHWSTETRIFHGEIFLVLKKCSCDERFDSKDFLSLAGDRIGCVSYFALTTLCKEVDIES